MKYEFKLVEGRIILVATLQVWGEVAENSYDVTDKVMPVVDEFIELEMAKFFAGINEESK